MMLVPKILFSARFIEPLLLVMGSGRRGVLPTGDSPAKIHNTAFPTEFL